MKNGLLTRHADIRSPAQVLFPTKALITQRTRIISSEQDKIRSQRFGFEQVELDCEPDTEYEQLHPEFHVDQMRPRFWERSSVSVL